MRIAALCGLVVAAVLALGAPAKAKEPGWCATYRNGGNNCGFYTYEQCMAAISGVGGFCNKSPYAEPEKPAARKERKEREAEPKAKRKEKEKEEVKERVAPKPVPAPVVVQPPAAQPPPAQQPASQPANNFAAARALILSGKYDAGIAAMKALGYDDHPDVASSIGLANAKLGRLDEARAWYSKALAADPNHLSTWGYSGALFVAQGDIAGARRDLERIKAICGGTACREYQELDGLIAAKAR